MAAPWTGGKPQQGNYLNLYLVSFSHTHTELRAGETHGWAELSYKQGKPENAKNDLYVAIREEHGSEWGRWREATENQSGQNETWFVAIFLSQYIFPGCLPSRAQSLLLCVLMHKFRSRTKPWFLYSSEELVKFLPIHKKKSQLIWPMTLIFYH